MSPLNPNASDGVPCPLCGETAERRQDEYGGATAFWVCSPCRAEHDGAIQLVPPDSARGTVIAERVEPHHGDRGAAVVGLRTWAEAMRQYVQSVESVAYALVTQPDAEAVANALMGDFSVFLMAEPVATMNSMLVRGLPPATARRLAKVVPHASGPPLPPDRLRQLEAEAGGRKA